ncbi:MAG: class II aldolase/adducin family protein [Phycisphaerales bacterium]|nr:class II aldolase/adducin family protein [Phycisphaerales bacterium]
MKKEATPPRDLVELSRALGDPDLAILSEGNASCRADDGTFWIKASGASLATLGETELVKMRSEPITRLLDERASDQQVAECLRSAKIDDGRPTRASIEATMHAALLEFDGVSWVGHTHPSAINAITCSLRFGELLAGRVFPEEVVVLGPASLLIEYADPGVPLGIAVREGAREYLKKYHQPPRAIYLKNHGFIAAGSSARDVLNITLMAVKSAKVRTAAAMLGGLHFMSDADVRRMGARADVDYRKKLMVERELSK